LRRDGYVVAREILPRALVDDVGAFLADEVDRAVAVLRREFGVHPDGDLVAAIDVAVANGGAQLPKETRDVAIGHFPLAVRLSERLWPIATALRGLVAALLPADRVAVHLPPAARYVLPRNARAGVPPHQDFRYNTHLPHFLTVWVPFVDVDELCGGVVVFDGPRRDDLQLPAPDGPWLGGVATDGFIPRRPELQRGDVLVLDDRVVHGSAPNLSERVRISADYRFFDGAQRSGKHALDLDSMAVILPESA
jgi:ectoine hydroxylase-related dioxygenase (phytanoyl-CoA dioxygenase family)